MVFRTTPSLGPDVEQKFAAPAFYDNSRVTAPTPQLGTVIRGSDGGEYFWVQASANVAATATTGTQVDLTFATHSIATGSGGFYTPPGLAVAKDECCYVRRGAWNANPA